MLPCSAASGSIPAWAGETHMSSLEKPQTAVYPRVGGGNLADTGNPGLVEGLSPRGRGKRGRVHQWAHNHRSIPAWAGETRLLVPGLAGCGVYPRVGGGNAPDPAKFADEEGLSPRGRGKLAAGKRNAALSGSIPAWAGETNSVRLHCAARQVYPRVGGGNFILAFTIASGGGLSPRGRGKPSSKTGLQRQPRSIPAWAGETR